MSSNSNPTPGTLWVVATPLGNPGDLSPRARTCLEKADAVLAEDTRRADGWTTGEIYSMLPRMGRPSRD